MSAGWGLLDERFGIRASLHSGQSVTLTASEIKEVSRREPRLMTKFDHRDTRPPFLKKATILPTRNGTYVILPGDGYHDVEPVERRTDWLLPRTVEAQSISLPWRGLPTSESQAIDMALASGVLEDHLGETSLRQTIHGRRRSPAFEFTFGTGRMRQSLAVEGVQIEVDGGFEGEALHLIEAKMGSVGDFHLRQLYYPYRMWRQNLRGKKRVVPTFLAYSNRTFILRTYRWTDPHDYNSLVLERARNYTLILEDIDRATLPRSVEQALALSSPAKRTSLPFPQADDFGKVIDVVDAVHAGIQTKDDLAELYAFNHRQSDYYGNAALFLGLVERGRGGFLPSSLGKRFAAASRSERDGILLQQLAQREVFREGLGYLAEHWESAAPLPEIRRIEGWMVKQRPDLGGQTRPRRAKTVSAWLDWVYASVELN